MRSASADGGARAGVPARVDVKVGFSCNNRCTFCVQGERRRRERDRRTDNVVAAMRRGRDAGATGVVLTGGEVTLRRDLTALVAAARALGFTTVQLQSNGRMFAHGRLCDDVIAAGATEFALALHGPSPAVHDTLVRAPGAFAQTVAGIRNLKARGQRVLANSVLVSGNLAHVEALARLLVALRVDQYQLAVVHPLGAAAIDAGTPVPRLSAIAAVVPRALAPGIAAGIPVMVEAMPLCFLRGLERCAAELRIPATCIEDPRYVLADYGAWRRRDGKAHGPPCVACTWRAACEGPWREFPAVHGWDEYVTRTDPCGA
jgi:pyruvate-formate lyase-activating enzyme